MDKIWDALAWIVVVLITVWLILKTVGIINTPLLVQYSPFFGAVYLAGYMVHKLNRATEDIHEIKGEIKTIKTNIIDLDKQIISVKERIML